ncbi:MAG: hypothetical protein KDC71_15635, partial [Acidobacteria bacterium]|nr:hypothetical protein [Acidobacteriota bacterium]
MRLIAQTKLFFKQGSSDKVYEVDLCEVSDGKFVVNFRYGRRGSNLKDGSKTALPVVFERAEAIYNDLIAEKKKGGYSEGTASGPVAKIQRAPQIQADSRESALMAQLKQAVDRSPSRKKLRRLLWRVGFVKMPQASVLIQPFLQHEDDLTLYCALWALGRCGAESYAADLESIWHNPAKADHIRLLAREVYRGTLAPHEQTRLFHQLVQQWPDEIAAALNDSAEAFCALMAEYRVPPTDKPPTILEDLYCSDRKEARDLLLYLVCFLEFRSAWWPQFRRLYKWAEFREDTHLLGLMVHRLEKTGANSPQLNYSLNAKVKGRNAKRPRYYAKTAQYLRGRAWRMLNKLAKLDSERYVAMATDILLPFEDADIRSFKVSEYDYRARRFQQWDGFGLNFANSANWILFGQSRRVAPSKNRTWASVRGAYDAKQIPDIREESFPEHWEKHPQYLVKLLCASRLYWAHRFALRILKELTGFEDQIENQALGQMLATPYNETHEFALNIVQKRVSSGQPVWPFMLGLLQSNAPKVFSYGEQLANQNILAFPQQSDLMSDLLVSHRPETRKWFRTFLSRINLSLDQAIALLNQVLTRINADLDDTCLDDATNTILESLGDALVQLDANALHPFLESSHSRLAILGTTLMIHRQAKSGQNPDPDLLQRVLGHDSDQVRLLGLQAISAMPLRGKLAIQEVMLRMALDANASIRDQALSILADMAFAHDAFQLFLSNTLAHYLLVPEPHSGVHRSIADFFERHPRLSLAIETPFARRLMRCFSLSAKAVGSAHLMQRIQSGQTEPADLFALASSDLHQARAFALSELQNRASVWRTDLDCWIPLLESDWSEVQQ